MVECSLAVDLDQLHLFVRRGPVLNFNCKFDLIFSLNLHTAIKIIRFIQCVYIIIQEEKLLVGKKGSDNNSTRASLALPLKQPNPLKHCFGNKFT